ncbi:MAG: DEAD/DEAH box helicase [Clostridiales bacterium]|nr:DEAD/DEAH box helicase [Clostridiales bacterium]
MGREVVYTGKVNKGSEELFIDLFCDVFGPDKSQYIFVQYPFIDIYGNHRFIDFAFESEDERIAIEVDGETYHNPNTISENKYFDDLLKQNSLVYNNWKIYRWVYSQLKNQPEKVKDEMLTFFGELPMFKMIDDYLPSQRGKVIELKDHQYDAMASLQNMRDNGDSIALLYHATGTGKTVTAVSDAKVIGKRTLFIGHTKELIEQARGTFRDLWKDRNTGLYVAEEKDKDAYIVCGSVQSISQNLEEFQPEDFGYLIIDEAHHGTATTYKKILSYFKPEFTLGLTATPHRTDGEDLLEVFKNIAHKLDLKKAVEIGELVPIRCIRVKTNVDISGVRINGIKYNSRDLESKLFIPERNRVIVDTYLEFAKGKKTVIFCASVNHAKEIAGLLKGNGINSVAVSGSMKSSARKKTLREYEKGDIDVLCACDLLNEGWDSPNTRILFMARPTMSKTLYTQQLGRGMRLAEGKDHLMVFDFIDNANLFNMPYSLHRMFNIKEYTPGGYVIAPAKQRQLEKDLLAKGEKPAVYLDFPVDIKDYELVELFNWQDEVRDMISQLEFVRMVDVQSETIERCIREGKIVPDLEIPVGRSRTFKYFKEEKVYKYAKQNGWELITPANMKDKFMEYIERMDMSYSYKPVLLKGVFDHIDDRGRVRLEDLTDYFIDYYETRREKGLAVEKRQCLYLRDYTRNEVTRNILANPFKRFEDMNFMRKSKDIEYIELSRHIRKRLTAEEIEGIIHHCDRKLDEYFHGVGAKTE